VPTEVTRGRTAPFSTIPHALLRDPGADAHTIAVYAALRAHADHTTGEGAYPSQKRLSEWAGCSWRTVMDRLEKLESLGWIECKKRPGHTSVYTVHDVNTPAGAAGGGLQEMQRGSAGDAEVPLQEMQTTENQFTENPLPDKRANGSKSTPRLDYTAEFEEAWKIHPRGSKKDAAKHYAKAVPDRITHDRLLKALTSYVRSEVRDDFKGVHLHRWIRDDRWDEQFTKRSTNGQRKTRELDPELEEEIRREREAPLTLDMVMRGR
jgi:hypothetical protein